MSGTACVLLLLLLSEPLLIEGRSGNVAFNENITVMAARIQIIRKDTRQSLLVECFVLFNIGQLLTTTVMSILTAGLTKLPICRLKCK